jgi:hypothetical protein
MGEHMQYSLFDVDGESKEGWEVIEIRSQIINGRERVDYCHTRPKNWREPIPTNKLPWEP